MRTVFGFGALFLTLVLLGPGPATAQESDQGSVGNPDAKCVKCHSRGLKKKLEDGDTMSLKVDVDAFATSVHQVIGCTGCHRDVAKGKHPSREPIASARAYSLKHNQTCSQCHAAKSRAYEDSIHAKLVAAGSEEAPLCSDCHSAHAIQPRQTYQPATGEPCSNCHADIFTAYEESVHGHAFVQGNRFRGADVRAPICADCHSAHDISAVAAAGFLVDTCMSCHEEARAAHEQWLPNAPMHLQSVGCAACHSPDAGLRVNLQFWDQAAGAPIGPGEEYAELREELAGVADGDDQLSSLELWRLIRLSRSLGGSDSNIVLLGRLEVANGMDAHRLQDSSQATRSCENCHESESRAFDTVTVSITRPDGRRQRFDADSAVLSSVISVDSISGFYAPGGTRIKLLDYLLVLAALGGLAVPVVHIALGKMVRRRSKKH
jgi:hypothetical protein